MRNRFLLTPFFLDRAEPALESLANETWWRNPGQRAGASELERVASIHQPLVAAVRDAARAGGRPVSVAGDCCAAIAVLAGLQAAGLDPILLWLDAHGDFNTRETTPSGFVGGMPLAMITGRGDQTLVQAAGLRPLRDEDVVLCDARDLDPGERAALEASGVRRIDDVGRILDELPDRPLYVHFDTDILDPSDAPAMLYPVPGGPALDELLALAEILQKRRLVAVSMTPWAIDHDPDERTAAACRRVFTALTAS